MFWYLLYKITTIITIQKVNPSIGRNHTNKIIKITNDANANIFIISIISLPKIY
jgi:hypothetical protein